MFLFTVPGQEKARGRRSSPLGVAAQLASNRWRVIAIGVVAQKNVEAKILYINTIQKVAAPSEGNRLSAIV